MITAKILSMKKDLPIIKKMLAEASPNTIVFPSAQSVKMFFEEELVAELFSSQFIHDEKVTFVWENELGSVAQFDGVQPDAKPETPTKK